MPEEKPKKISELIEELAVIHGSHGDLYVIGADDCHVTDIGILPDSFDPETDEKVNMVQLK